jgi:hypothetical protein
MNKTPIVMKKKKLIGALYFQKFKNIFLNNNIYFKYA